MSQSQQSRNWCFTLNNYTADEEVRVGDSEPKYMVYGRETAPDTGTPHLQGYIVFKTNKRLGAVKNILPRAHWSIAKGDAAQNYAYCTKDGDFEEMGIKPLTKKEIGENEKQRWSEIITHAKAGTLEDHDPKVYFIHYNTALKLQAKYEKPEKIVKTVKVFWGSTGSGKSWTAWDEAGPDAYVKDPRSKFWYGYSGQENVIIDEFRGGIDISHVLRWLDDYPVLVEVKGSSCALKVKNIWITSNLHPKNWYPELDTETLQALLRRVKVTEFHSFFNKQH